MVRPHLKLEKFCKFFNRYEYYKIYIYYKYLPMSFERFISLKTRITMVLSESFEFTLFAAPNVLRTDSIFLRPKS